MIGVLLRNLKILGQAELKVLPLLVMSLTMPAAMISSLSDFVFDASMMLLVLLGIVSNLLMMAGGWFISRKSSDKDKALTIICSSGFAISSFVLPYAQEFMGPEVAVSVSVFDAGNAMMVLGLNVIIASHIIKKGQHEPGQLKRMSRQLLSSVPFVAVLLMLTLSALELRLPSPVLSTIRMAASANTFLAMLMLGTMIDLSSVKERLKSVSRTMVIRYVLCTLMAFLSYRWLPMPQTIRFAMVLCFFAPLSSVSPLFVEQLGGDKDDAGLIASFSIIIGLIVMSGLLVSGGGQLG